MRNEYQERCLAEAKALLEDIRSEPTCSKLEMFHRCMDKASASFADADSSAREIVDLHQRSMEAGIRCACCKAGNPECRDRLLGGLRRQFAILRDNPELATPHTMATFVVIMETLDADYADIGTDETVFRYVARPAMVADLRGQLAIAREIKDIEALVELRSTAFLNGISFEDLGISEKEFRDIFMESLSPTQESDRLN